MSKPPSLSEKEQKQYADVIAHLSGDARFVFSRLITTYKPTVDRCRPRIRAGQGPHASLLGLPGLEPTIAAMAVGQKHVWSLDTADSMLLAKKLVADTAMQSLFVELRFSCLSLTTGLYGMPTSIVFTPKGGVAALLLCKAKLTKRCSHYLYGHLLGYSNDDIKAYYERKKEQYQQSFCCILDDDNNLWQAAFEKDKQSALAWVDNHKADIDSWFVENSAKATMYKYYERNAVPVAGMVLGRKRSIAENKVCPE